tara:strand:- start:42 stop:209 length:168 start_codon:yes stop_codon:yes gene_type:complete
MAKKSKIPKGSITERVEEIRKESEEEIKEKEITEIKEEPKPEVINKVNSTSNSYE